VKVLVLGGTGFVGSHVARAYVEAGHEVAVSVRARSPRGLIADLEVEEVACDLDDPDSVLAACQGREVVVFCIGLLSLWPKDADALYRVNVLGARRVVEACLQAGVRRLVYNGTVGVYAGSPSPEPVDERGSSYTDRFDSFHVFAMCLAEAEVFRGIARGLDAILLHPSLCLGSGDRSMHSSWALIGLATMKLSIVPPGGLNLVDVLDVARANLLAATGGVSGRAYLIGGENLTNRAFADMLQEALGIPGRTIGLGRGTIRALGRGFELISRVTGQDHGSYVTLNEALAHAMSLYWFVDDRRAREELGHGASPIGPALERQVAWLRQEGLLSDGLAAFARRFLQAP
jgi:dihydroflavonol-4-reductase